MPPTTLTPDQQHVLARMLRIQNAIIEDLPIDHVDQPLTSTADPHIIEAERALAAGKVEQLSVMGLVMAVTATRALMTHFQTFPADFRHILRSALEPLERYFEAADLHFQGQPMLA